MSQEPLQSLPPEKWGELQSAFKKDWPRGAPAHSVLAMQKQWMDRGIDYDFKVYCPFGDVQDGMVALNEKNAYYEVIIQCPSDNVENLSKALKKTKIIDWKKSIIIPYAPNHIIELIKTILEDVNVEIEFILPLATFILKTKTPYTDLNERCTRIMSQEPLQRLPPEKWGELQNAFKKDWPRGAAGYAVLAMQKQWMDRSIDYDFKVYCPFGDVQNGMVAVNEKTDFYEVIIQCPSDDLENLGKALKITNIIDWKRSIIIPYVPYNIIELIKTISEDINVEIELILPSARFILETRTPYDDINLPEGMSFGLLTNKYVELIDSTWPHRYPSSTTYFKLLIENKYGYGLFLNNTLICWLLINESGNLAHMYTVKEYRQKGYAELLLKFVCNVLIEDGKTVSAYCLEDNYNAIKLYNKAGFERIEGVAWCFLRSKIN